jgi:hypothetical protein
MANSRNGVSKTTQTTTNSNGISRRNQAATAAIDVKLNKLVSLNWIGLVEGMPAS